MTDCSRVLRHTQPAGEPFGLLSKADIDNLIALDRETGALGASIEEIRALVALLNAPRQQL